MKPRSTICGIKTVMEMISIKNNAAVSRWQHRWLNRNMACLWDVMKAKYIWSYPWRNTILEIEMDALLYRIFFAIIKCFHMISRHIRGFWYIPYHSPNFHNVFSNKFLFFRYQHNCNILKQLFWSYILGDTSRHIYDIHRASPDVGCVF